MSDQNRIDEYDSEPVVYCARCYSLKIKHEDAIDSDCCMDCGCSDVLTSTIYEWERLYERRYGHKYVTKRNDPRNSEFYKMSVGELKTWVYNSIQREAIIKKLYPKFPKGLTNAESVILLFDKLAKDRRIDDLRKILNYKSIGNGREEK